MKWNLEVTLLHVVILIWWSDMFKNIQNNRGSILLAALAAAAAMGLGLYFLADSVTLQKKQIVKTVNAVQLHFALSSTMDYVLFGVRQKYCFTDDNLLLNAATDVCDLKHTGSVERLIMSVDQENFIKAMKEPPVNLNVGPVDINNISLSSISRYLKFDAVSADHPLFAVLQGVKSVKDDVTGAIVKVDGVQVTLQRDESGYLPQSGREVYINARLELKTGKGSPAAIVIGSKPLVIQSQIVIYPREVGSFALLVANDLHLDLPWDATMAKGDVSLHNFGNKIQAGAGSGLVFLSPVFVNQDIYLPQTNSAKYNAVPYVGNYSAVTFSDRVYLGNGWIKNSDGSQFEPLTSGVITDRFWTDIPTFGGFRRGIENDGGADKGLNVLANVFAPSPDVQLMSDCINRSNFLSSKAELYKSQLMGKLKQSNPGSFNYRLYFDKNNQFNPQDSPILAVNLANWGSGVAARTGPDKKPIMELTFFLNGKNFSAQLTSNSVLTVVPEISQVYLNSLKNGATSALNNVNSAQSALTALTAQLARANSDLVNLNSALAVEKAKPIAPTPTPTPTPVYQDPNLIISLNSQILALNAKINQLSSVDIPAQEIVISAAQAASLSAKSTIDNIIQNPPTFGVEVTPVSIGGSNNYTDRVNIKITATNVNHLFDASGNLVAPSIGILGYDGTYFNGVSVANDPNPNLLRFINFTVSPDKMSLVAPDTLSANSKSPGILDPNVATADTIPDPFLLDLKCEQARSTTTSASFGGAGWDLDFSAQTRNSWNFAGDGGTFTLTGPIVNKTLILGSNDFSVYSIVKECKIPASVNFITGFFTCDKLTIEARVNPLRIIGTFIVGSLSIHPTAYVAGITWSSIYYPQATQELRTKKVLKPLDGASCDVLTEPIWHPVPSIQEVSNRMSCNVVSLRAKANPFQWTAVDPDCGLLPGASNTTCKHRLIRFFVVEQSREGGH